MSWEVQEARNGDLTLLINGLAVHSRFNPVSEARRAAAAIPPEAGIVVLGGFGLGYVAEALIENNPERSLVITEADSKGFEKALKARNLSALLSHPNVKILAGGNPELIRDVLSSEPVGSPIHWIPWKPSIQNHPQWYRKVETTLQVLSDRRQINARTLERFGNLWIRNLVSNTPHLEQALSIDDLKNRFTDIPALILAGGPSLETALPFLNELRERHLIITVDTALSAVLRNGIRPDIITVVDPQYWNTRHLDRCGERAENTLVLSEISTHPAVFRVLRGRPIFTRSRFPLATLFENAAGLRGELKAGGSVATAAWELGRHLGCCSLTASGLDLGFPGFQSHYTGALSRELPHYHSNRLNTATTAGFHSLYGAYARKVPSAEGSILLTDQRMDVYAVWFEESAASIANRNPVTLGGQGRAIPGFGVTEVTELLKKPPLRGKINALLEKIHTIPVDAKRALRISEASRQILNELKTLESNARRGHTAAVKAFHCLETDTNPSTHFKTMNDVDKEILSTEGREVVSFLIQPIIMKSATHSRGKKTNPIEDSLYLYEGIMRSAQYHIRQLQHTSKKFN